ncbi:MAG: aminotransferase class I/II-fold pyridoxal phosphate-dependent enzyme [Planctomycetia bacterium]|nr:aminotransferase class I/II-fold pyridoxal phosphate-dependent enzyme [Planctomycetia bacterium]RLT15700.1 MAG: aminotransferase class I/II-fold pyridoxal phosphate-dependent enzyme [Planctomycetota bacterium]
MNLPFEETRQLRTATRAIHCGEGVDAETKAIRRPIVMANSFKLNDTSETLAESFAWENTHAFNYPRSRHPNARYLEERLAGLEGGEDCVVFSSGVAAVGGVFFSLLSAGDHMVSSRICYIGIHGLLVEHLGKRFGVEVSMVDSTNVEDVRAAIRPTTKLVHIETPSNPTTLVSDIAAIAAIARTVGALVTVDSTFSGIIAQQPLLLGADLVMHSLTKYINGHGDGLGGAVIGRQDLITRIRDAASIHLGATINPFGAWLMSRSVVTLPLRMQRHCENGLRVAQFLESHPKVKLVRYPGLESHPQHAIARRQMDGYGGMLNFILAAEKKDYFRFLESLRVITHAVCLGHAESLVQYYPQEGNHPELGVLNYPEDIGEGFLRLSVGLEDAKDLIADLAQALEKIPALRASPEKP